MSQARIIEVHADPSLRDFYWGNLLVCGTLEPRRLILFVLSIVFLGAMVWKVLSASENEVLADSSIVVGWVLFPLLLACLVFGLPYLTIRRQVRQNPKVLGPTDYVFSEKGVEMTGRFGRSEVQWGAFIAVRETKRFFLLHTLPRQAYLVPKRCFSSNAEAVEFRNLLKQVFPGRLDLRST